MTLSSSHASYRQSEYERSHEGHRSPESFGSSISKDSVALNDPDPIRREAFSCATVGADARRHTHPLERCDRLLHTLAHSSRRGSSRAPAKSRSAPDVRTCLSLVSGSRPGPECRGAPGHDAGPSGKWDESRLCKGPGGSSTSCARADACTYGGGRPPRTLPASATFGVEHERLGRTSRPAYWQRPSPSSSSWAPEAADLRTSSPSLQPLHP